MSLINEEQNLSTTPSTLHEVAADDIPRNLVSLPETSIYLDSPENILLTSTFITEVTLPPPNRNTFIDLASNSAPLIDSTVLSYLSETRGYQTSQDNGEAIVFNRKYG